MKCKCAKFSLFLLVLQQSELFETKCKQIILHCISINAALKFSLKITRKDLYVLYYFENVKGKSLVTFWLIVYITKLFLCRSLQFS